MTIRVWLMVADCWQCGISVELTADQEREIRTLLRTDPEDPATATVERLAARAAKPSAPSSTRTPTGGAATLPAAWQQSPHVRSTPHTTQHRTMPSAAPASPPLPSAHLGIRDWLRDMPAWLASLLFHMAVLALLALLMMDGNREDPYITLSTEANRWSQSGGVVTVQDPRDDFHYDLPLPESDTPHTDQAKQAVALADQDARELRVNPRTVSPQLPALHEVKQLLRSKELAQRSLAARDPRVRVEMVKIEGGTTLTEAAVARGLRWMAQHQHANGSWSLDRFHEAGQCRHRCSEPGSIRSDSAATSLCLLPFLGAGQTHQTGIYQDAVSQGLRWLLQIQAANGDLRAHSQGNSGMYAHGQGAIVLCEAYAMTRDERLRDPAQRAIQFIVNAQHGMGGWRYGPGEQGDTSVLGWQLMALQSAHMAGLEVPQESLDLAHAYLDSVAYEDGSQYAYQPGHEPTHVMTAEALLCRMYLGWNRSFASLELGIRHLLKHHLPNRNKTDFYYWYYATQVLHHYGGKEWNRWNMAMRDILVETQERRGHEAGSWRPLGEHATQAGRLYATSLAICTLEVYYRHAPIFRQVDLDSQ